MGSGVYTWCLAFRYGVWGFGMMFGVSIWCLGVGRRVWGTPAAQALPLLLLLACPLLFGFRVEGSGVGVWSSGWQDSDGFKPRPGFWVSGFGSCSVLQNSFLLGCAGLSRTAAASPRSATGDVTVLVSNQELLGRDDAAPVSKRCFPGGERCVLYGIPNVGS